jgi:hypothetical protein
MASLASLSCLAKQIMTNAGYPDVDVTYIVEPAMKWGKDPEFVVIISTLHEVAMRKQEAYGDGRLQVTSADYDVKMTYSDLYRKAIRIDQLMATLKTQVWNGDPRDYRAHALMDTFSDLAVYAMRAIQILHRLQQRGAL